MQEYYFLVINNKKVPWEYFWQNVQNYFFKEYVKELATNCYYISFQNINFEWLCCNGCVRFHRISFYFLKFSVCLGTPILVKTFKILHFIFASVSWFSSFLVLALSPKIVLYLNIVVSDKLRL